MGHFMAVAVMVGFTAAFSMAVEVQTGAFSCTFPVGWLNLGVFGSSVSDSSVSLIKTGDGSSYAFASLSLFPNENADPTDTALPEGVLTDSLSYVIQKRDTQILGKYSFQSFEYEWTTAGSDSTPPGQYNGAMWQTHVSGHTFMTVLSSSQPGSDLAASISEVEQALTTLDIHATSLAIGNFRKIPSPARSGFIQAADRRFDILGRHFPSPGRTGFHGK